MQIQKKKENILTASQPKILQNNCSGTPTLTVIFASGDMSDFTCLIANTDRLTCEKRVFSREKTSPPVPKIISVFAGNFSK